MSLRAWAKKEWLHEHRTSPQEISDLLGIVARDIEAAQLEDLDNDWKLAIAYNAALQCATIALAASGYRAARVAHHYRVIQSLEFTLKLPSDVVDQLDAFRQKRNTGDYDRAGTTSEHEAAEVLELAIELNRAVRAWLRLSYPHLLTA